MSHVRDVALLALGALVLFVCLQVGQARQHRALRADAVTEAQARAGDGFRCWAEDNDEMPLGYEVLCRKV